MTLQEIVTQESLGQKIAKVARKIIMPILSKEQTMLENAQLDGDYVESSYRNAMIQSDNLVQEIMNPHHNPQKTLDQKNILSLYISTIDVAADRMWTIKRCLDATVMKFDRYRKELYRHYTNHNVVDKIEKAGAKAILKYASKLVDDTDLGHMTEDLLSDRKGFISGFKRKETELLQSCTDRIASDVAKEVSNVMFQMGNLQQMPESELIRFALEGFTNSYAECINDTVQFGLLKGVFVRVMYESTIPMRQVA